MNPAQWQRAREIFDSICDLDPQAQEQALNSHDEATDVLKLVHDMLVADAGDRVRERLGDQAPGLTESIAQGHRQGQQVGPYEIQDLIGRGGMGEVYRAERSDGTFELTVAIKFVALPSPEMAARFERERHLLARLEHPNIARLLDGGIDDQGFPYLVMDHVAGLPIDRYCNQYRLSIERRLILFCRVLAAVSAAHRQLVIHRDIKPGNVLVDEKGQPKLVDFGIGKLLEDDDPSQTLTRHPLLSPQYAAPEQISGGIVGTHTDIYQLGLLLDELLSGEPARQLRDHSVEQWVSSGLAEVQPPAERFKDSERRAQIARERDTGVEKLARKLSGDLRWILAKACRREPEKRYHSTDEMLADIEAFLEGKPVRARKPSARYLVRRFVGRHRYAVAATVAAALGLGSLAGLSLYQAREAERQRLLAVSQEKIASLEALKQQEVKAFLLDLFRYADPAVNLSNTITAEALLDRAERKLAQDVADPLTQASLSQAIGAAYFGLGMISEAETHLKAAVTQFEQLEETASKDYALAAYTLGQLYLAQVDEAADIYHHKALRTREQLYPDGHPEIAQSLLSIARARRHLEPREVTMATYDRALAIIERFQGRQSPTYAEALGQLASFLGSRGEFEQALPHSQLAYAIASATMDNRDPRLASLVSLLGTLESDSGRLQDAEQHLNEALRMYESTYDSLHPKVLSTTANLSSPYSYLGDTDKMIALAKRHLEAVITVFGEVSPKAAFGWDLLGESWYVAGDYLAAIDAHQRAIDIQVQLEQTRYSLRSLMSKGRSLLQVDRFEEANTVLERAIADDVDVGSNYHTEALTLLAQTQLYLDKPELALETAERALAASAELDTLRQADAHTTLGSALRSLGRLEDAARHFSAADLLLQDSPMYTARFIRTRLDREFTQKQPATRLLH